MSGVFMTSVQLAIPILAAHFGKTALIEFAAVVIVLVGLLVLPSIRRTIWAPASTAPPARPMRRRGIVAVYLLMALIVGGSLLDLVRDTEHWPWSNFPMYSRVEDVAPTFEDYRLYGVVADDAHSEISLSTDIRYLQPFDPSRLAEALVKLAGDPRIDEGLLDCLNRYESLRKSGAHKGPPLVALRLYRVRFTLDPWGRNTDQPDQKTLIRQVELPTEKPL
jgi:hypothetical protein